MIKIKRYITCILIFAMVLTSVVTMTVGEVDAAAKGTADALVDHAMSHYHQNYKLKGCETFTWQWCVSFIAHCSYRTGCTRALPYDGIKKQPDGSLKKQGTLGSGSYPDKLVNKFGAKITYVNKTSYKHFKGNYTKDASGRVSYNLGYIPQKGDIAIFAGNSYNKKGEIVGVNFKSREHVGLVYETSKSSKSALHTIEGNVRGHGNDNQYYKNSTVEIYPNRSKAKLIGFVTPNYSDKQTFTVKYNANGGKGTMANTTVTYGTKTPLRNNQFVKEGYKFVGWTAKRDNNTWRYIQPNGSKDGWYAEGKQPSGWKKYVYRNQENVLHTYNKNKGVVTFYAQWEKAPVHTFYYDTKGGSVTPPSMQVAESTRFSITQLLPEKEGCMFEGWTVRRTADNKCYVTGKGWLTDAEIKSKGYTKRIYTPGEGYTLDAAWTNGYSGVSNYIFEAQWKRQEELSFTANYDANGGSGTMAYTTIKVGEPTPLRKNQFTRDGYE